MVKSNLRKDGQKELRQIFERGVFEGGQSVDANTTEVLVNLVPFIEAGDEMVDFIGYLDVGTSGTPTDGTIHWGIGYLDPDTALSSTLNDNYESLGFFEWAEETASIRWEQVDTSGISQTLLRWTFSNDTMANVQDQYNQGNAIFLCVYSQVAATFTAVAFGKIRYVIDLTQRFYRDSNDFSDCTWEESTVGCVI